MRQIQQRGLRALLLLEEREFSLDELADKLCICRRYAQGILKNLKDSGFTINSRMKGRVKYFWIDQSPDLLPAILTKDQTQAIRIALTAPNENLKTAIYKLTQYVNVQLYFHLHK